MIGRSWNSSSVSVADSRNSVLLPGVQPKLHANDMKKNDVNEKGGENGEKMAFSLSFFNVWNINNGIIASRARGIVMMPWPYLLMCANIMKQWPILVIP